MDDLLPGFKAIPSGDAGITAAVRAAEVGIKRYIADTGSGLHLVSMEQIKSQGLVSRLYKLAKKVRLLTAGEETATCKGICIQFPGMQPDELMAHVLDDTPPVISVGALCQRYGYGFYWPSCSDYPYFEMPNGKRIVLEVDRHIPYFVFDEVGEAGPARPCMPSMDEEPLLRWSTVSKSAHTFVIKPLDLGGPERQLIRRRVTLDLHTRACLQDLDLVEDSSNGSWSCHLGEPRDLLTYVYYVRGEAEANRPAVPNSGGDPEPSAEPPVDEEAEDFPEHPKRDFKTLKEKATSVRHL